MNAHDLYQNIKKACVHFGLAFYEMNLIQVSFNEGEVTFTYQKETITVKL